MSAYGTPRGSAAALSARTPVPGSAAALRTATPGSAAALSARTPVPGSAAALSARTPVPGSAAALRTATPGSVAALSARTPVPTATPAAALSARTPVPVAGTPTPYAGTPTPVAGTPTPMTVPAASVAILTPGTTPGSATALSAATPTPVQTPYTYHNQTPTGTPQFATAILMDDDYQLPEQTKAPQPIMAGWCRKRGTLGYHPRYYALTSDGKLWSAKNTKTKERKQMLTMTETTQLNPTNKSDLVIKGHDAKGKKVSIALRFNEVMERDEWVGAFITATEDIVEQNKMLRKEEQMEQDTETHNQQVLLNYYHTYKPDNANPEKVQRFLKLFQGNMSKLATALGHKYGATPDLETTDDVSTLPTPSFSTIFTPMTDNGTIMEESEEEESSSSSFSDTTIESKFTDRTELRELPDLMGAVFQLLESDPPLLYNPDALQLGLRASSPHLRPTRPQIEGVLTRYQQKRREDDAREQFVPTQMMATDLMRVRTTINGLMIAQEDLVILMWELKLSPRSIPLVDNETLLGVGKQQLSLRNYAHLHGSDMAKRLMTYDDPVEFMSKRKQTRSCQREFARAFLVDTPREITDKKGNVRKDSMLSQFVNSQDQLRRNVGGKLLQYYDPNTSEARNESKRNDVNKKNKKKEKERCCDCLMS